MSRQLAFDRDGWEDYADWQRQDKRTLKRLVYLVTDTHIVVLQARDHY